MLKTIGDYAILLIVLAAIVAVAFVACTAMGVTIPGWVVHVFWILVICIVCVGAIKLLMGGRLPPASP